MKRLRETSGLPWAAGLALSVLLLTAPLCAKDALLILRPEGRDFSDAVRGLTREIGEEFTIGQRTLGSKAEVADVAGVIREIRPRLVVLMDNPVIRLYRRYQASLPDSVAPTPSLSLMAASLDREMRGLRLAAGIAYEVPIVTSALGLRSVVGRPLPRIGIVHREFMAGFVAGNAEYCRREGITLVAAALRNKEPDFRKAVRKSLRTLLEEEKVDALWIPNDNSLLAPDILRDVWIPLVNRHRKPVIVGVEALAQPGLGFGTFAVLPDHTELGRQLAETVLDISSAGYAIPDGQIRQPISVIKVLNLPQARKFAGTGRERLGSVDRILE
jgi:hypothetical protein